MEEIRRENYPFPCREFHYVNRYYAIGNAVHCHLQIEGNIAMWHVYIEKMTGTLLKEIRRTLPEFMLMLKGLGVDRLIGVKPIDENIKVWEHFLALWGMVPLGDIEHEGRLCRIMNVEV